MLKRTIGFAIFSIFMFSLISVACAQDEKVDIEFSEAIVLNEYEGMANLYKEMSTKSTFQQKSMGLKDDQIVQIMNYKNDFDEHIQKLNDDYSDDQLRNLEYTDKQIKIIRNYDGSPESAKALSASVTINLSGPSSLQQNGNNLSAVLSYSFNWSSEPFWKGMDGVGIGAGGYPNTIEFDQGSQYTRATVNYYAPISKKTFTQNYTMNVSAPGFGSSISSKFPMERSSIPADLAYGKSGNGTILVRTVINPYASNQYITARASYGHQYIGGSFSIGFDAKAGVGLSFNPSSRIDTTHSAIKTMPR